jgi:hypothetical protein
MTKHVYRYEFLADAPLEEIESALVLALFSTESLHGQTRTRLESAHYLDRERRRLVLDASSRVGADFSRLFTGFLVRELGPDCFTVELIDRSTVHESRTNDTPKRE